MKIDLQKDDRVVAAFTFRDFVLAVTEKGDVFEIKVDYDAFNNITRLVQRA